MHIVIYGPEGSGKGTQAQMLSDRLSLPIYTSGDLVREAALRKRSAIGKVCKNALLKGQYVPDIEMFILWQKKLKSSQAKKGFILDGFPRNINQARFLKRIISQNGYHLNAVIYLKLSDEESIKRLKMRGRKLFTGSEINHDDPERVAKRLAVYHKQEEEVIRFYRREKILLQIDANKSINEVYNGILSKLDIS